ncbi:MAG: phosphate transport system regulatory protein PhoU [Candidatus Fraserbacteria bacterium RBG_16_55_9]|uniref:Phosphate-specific transport system accessory protein PhoU n=1 Tax=Fraserbacteria sp. (strain RBG_16_55_9) TaxID=1817864 RepID=A0A1F5V067_FRAXR|nr:MAG: phosphate transport system regulatory protein PhoU [Candidatus Fraserbacteria bacterium RBG_16_55_9]
MVRESYRQQLDGLLEFVCGMGQLVVEGLNKGLQAIRDHDRALALSLEPWDDTIDQMALDIEKKCTDLLALQQPVAVDLRLIVSVFKLVTDLERVADLAVNLGEYSLVSEAFVLVPKEQLLQLGKIASEMMNDSLEAIRTRDVARAKQAIARDRVLDQRCWDLRTEVLTQIIRRAGHANTSEQAKKIADNTITVLWSIRDLERVGDHAVNICARTIYWLTSNPEFI